LLPNVLKIYYKQTHDIRDFVLFCRVDRQLSQVTTKGYREHVQRLLRTLNKDPLEITKDDLRQYLKDVQENYSKWQYVYANALRSFKVYFRDYLNRGYLVDSFKFPKIPFYPKRVPTKEDIQRFYHAIADLKGKAMYLLFATSGLRRSELSTLLVENIDLKKRIVIPRTHSGATKKTWCTFFNKESRDVLLEYLGKKTQSNPKLFPWNSRKYGNIFWRKARKKTALKITPQTLRDWFCVEMGELGVQDRYIDAFCGRVPKSVLARHYTDYSPERLKRIYDKAGLRVLS
jgi:integrase